MSLLKDLALLAARRRPRSRQALGALALEAALLAYPPLRGPRLAGIAALRAALWAYPLVQANPQARRLTARALRTARLRLRASGHRGAALEAALVRYAKRANWSAS